MTWQAKLVDVRESRQLARPLEMRDGPGGDLVLEGYASTFHSYDVFGGPANGGWVERIDKRAFDKTLAARPDVQLLVNHEGWPLARTKSGTLELSVDHHGLKVRARLDRNDPDVQRLLPKLGRRDMDEMSFAFRVTGQEWDRDYTDRMITEVNLQKGDVSVVNYGMNPTTSVALRETVDALASLPRDRLVEVRSLLGLPAEPTSRGGSVDQHTTIWQGTLRRGNAELPTVSEALRNLRNDQHFQPVQRSATTTLPRALADLPQDRIAAATTVPVDPTSDRHLVYQRNSILRQSDDEERVSWVADLLKVHCKLDDDGSCRARLARHAQDVARDPAFREWRDLSGQGGGSFAVPPKFLIDDYVLVARSGRAFADCCTNDMLPTGCDSVNVPQMASGSAAAIQTADNTEIVVSEIADELITANVITVAGAVNASISLIEQSPVDYSAIIFRDLINAHAVQTDLQVIAGSGSAGQLLGVDNTPGVQSIAVSSTSIAGFYTALASALKLVNTSRYAPPEVIVMSPVRFSWLCALLDNDNRPILQPAANSVGNTAAVLRKVAPERIAGTLLSIPIVLDNNVTVDDGSDSVYVMRGSDFVLWESPFRFVVRPSIKAPNLTVALQAWSYSAFAPLYTSSAVRISGLEEPLF